MIQIGSKATQYPVGLITPATILQEPALPPAMKFLHKLHCWPSLGMFW
jgi:hypothetical protein